MVRIFFAVFLILHGLVHLIGVMRGLRLWNYDSWPYRTSVLFGRVELGEKGTRILGLIWLLPLLGFIAAGSGLLLAGWWTATAWLAAAFSLILCLLEWPHLWPGALLNVIILVILYFGDRIGWLAGI